jgi:hypothetical protein
MTLSDMRSNGAPSIHATCECGRNAIVDGPVARRSPSVTLARL